MFGVILVDGNNHAKRHHYASPDDVPARVSRDIARVAAAFPGAAVIIAWDHPESKLVRKSLFADYKADRDQRPDAEAAVASSLTYMRDKYPCWYHPEYEADDLIATLSRAYPDVKQVIYAKDADMHGLLVGPAYKVQLWSAATPLSESWTIYSAEFIEQQHGVKISQWYEYRALVGDSVDNLPGIAGIGAKTATSILRQYETVAQAFEAGDSLQVSPAMRKKLHTGYQDGTFALMLQLVQPRIKEKIPVELATIMESARSVPVTSRFNWTLDSLLQYANRLSVPAEEPPF